MTATGPTEISIKLSVNPKWLSIGFTLLILIVSYFTYFHNYSTPQAGYWDENYHIASAQKYLHGIFLMEPHPPLGKMLIALGEKLLHANATSDQFIGTDFAKDIPAEFSFAGYRFIPVLLAWLTAPLIFWIFVLITNNNLFALLLSSLYVFDNALIVHLRGAMLEGTLLFFMAMMILFFLLILRSRDRPRYFIVCATWFGIAFGLLTTTKVTGLIALLLFPAVLIKLWPDWKKCLTYLGFSSLGFLFVFITVWQIHFSVASQVNPTLSNDGYYEASTEYRQILDEHRTNSLTAFPIMLRDAIKFTPLYNGLVPKLDLCKPDEGGSPSFFWPLGARAINYRWETPDGIVYRYIYLQSNPVVWAVGLIGLILASSLFVASIFMGLPLQNGLLIGTFLAMYYSYMFVMSLIGRVMYLYHYFPPLVFSFFLFGLVLVEIKQIAKWQIADVSKGTFLSVMFICIFLSYQFFSPLTYYEPITDDAFRKRMIFPLWELRCVKCERQPILVLTETEKT